MSELVLDVRLDGFAEPIGALMRDTASRLTFSYSPRYLDGAAALPLSLSLPLTDEPAPDVLARAFFDNLLQERDAPLRAVMAKHGISRDDVASLLLHLGKDCAGAVSVLPQGAPPAKVPGVIATDYDTLDDAEVAGIVKALHERKPLPGDRQDPSPLAGVQSKISLLLLPDNRLAIPKSGTGAPTTHILKVPDSNHPRDARLEETAINLAHLTGLAAADVKVFAVAGLDALLVTRFDRTQDAEGRIIRIHQEDFAQALGLPVAHKYERHGEAGRRFDATAIRSVLDRTSNPDLARRAFIASTFFDLLIGNSDAHAKNHALIYDAGPVPRLAPRYDIVPTRLDPQVTEDFSFRIGTAENLSRLQKGDINGFLSTIGISRTGAQRRLIAEVVEPMAHALAQLLPNLQQDGLKSFADLIAANIRGLLPILNLDTPELAMQRDAFVARGGGWLSS